MKLVGQRKTLLGLFVLSFFFSFSFSFPLLFSFLFFSFGILGPLFANLGLPGPPKGPGPLTQSGLSYPSCAPGFMNLLSSVPKTKSNLPTHCHYLL